MTYYEKYLKYKSKYLKLLGGSGKGIYDPKNNICIPRVKSQAVQRKVYSINFLWLSRNVQTSHRRQRYIFPFDNKLILFTEIMFINLDYINNIINIIRWSQKNPRATVNIWHDSIPIIVENTRQLINNLLNNEELMIEIETIYKIIANNKLLNKHINQPEHYEENPLIRSKIDYLIDDRLTNQYLQININPGDPKIIDRVDIKQEFIDKINEINKLIKFNEETQTIDMISSPIVKTLENLSFESIVILDRLKDIITDKPLIEYFGLKIDGTPSLYDKLPVYYKVDLVRLIILLQLVSINTNSYAIYADFDTQSLDEAFIFTEESIRLLDTHGLVLPKGDYQIYENSFHILAGENVTCDNFMIISINKILIEYNIQKIIYEHEINPQDVFDNYLDLFTYYFIIKLDLNIQTGEIPGEETLIYFKDGDTFISFIDDLKEAYEREGIQINKTNLLELDMNRIGSLIFSEKKKQPNGIFHKEGFRFYNSRKYKDYYPIRDDLGDISPHHYNYTKKYLHINK